MTQHDETFVPTYHVGAPPAGLSMPPKRSRNTKVLLGVLGGLLAIASVCCIAAVVFTPETGNRKTEAAQTAPIPETGVQPAPVTKETAPEPAPPPLPEPPPDQTFNGKGDKVVILTDLDENFHYIATITHKGSGNFVIRSRDADGESIDLLVNEIGSYSGVRPVSLDEYPHALQIEANGSWSVTITVAQNAPVWSGTASGKGDAVLIVPSGTLNGLSTVRAVHSGSSNFVVTTYGTRRNLLINEIGKYSGEVLIGGGAVLIEIKADGSWSLQLA